MAISVVSPSPMLEATISYSMLPQKIRSYLEKLHPKAVVEWHIDGHNLVVMYRNGRVVWFDNNIVIGDY